MKKVIYKITNNKGEQLLKTPIWYNEKIKIDNNAIFYEDLYSKGITVVSDLLKDICNKIFYSFEEFKRKYDIQINFLKYYGLITAVSKLFPYYDLQGCNTPTKPFIPLNIAFCFCKSKGSKHIYNLLNETDRNKKMEGDFPNR